MKKFLGQKLLAILLLTFMLLPSLAAAQVRADDFSCQGIKLGDSDTTVLDVLGQPIYERTVRIQDILVKECDFDGDFTVGFAVMTGKVIDITIKNKQYTMRNGVRYGATSGLLQSTYGKTKKQMIDGNCFYIYDNPSREHEHLMLQVDASDGHLLVTRITGLPLSDFEIEEMKLASPELFREPEEQQTWFQLDQKEIDVSALPQDKPVRLGGLTE